MRIFIDTNVLVDMMDAARPNYEASKAILHKAEEEHIVLVLTGLTIVNALYAIRKSGYDKQFSRSVVDIILRIAEIASTDRVQLQAALDGEWTDYEDAVQYQAALTAGKVQAIITSDKKGFKDSQLPVLSPDSFIERYH